MFAASSVFPTEGATMKKVIIAGFAILAVSTSGAMAKKAPKPKAAAPAATAPAMGASGPMMFNQVSAADREMYMRNQRESGMKK
jgi:hypothetical protein